MKQPLEPQHPLDVLDHIQPVEVPPFLLTRILQKVEAQNHQTFSPKMVWSLSIACVILLLLNLFLIFQFMDTPNLAQNLAQDLELVIDNSLYQ